MNFETIIGCEVHIQLATASKAFCSCKNEFGGKPNSRVCPVCLGLPGSLPVPNRAMIDCAIMAGAALGCRIAPLTKFDRKNYMYPDLPKAYQISQYDMPIAAGGRLCVKTALGERLVRIRRVHMEEDTGKNIHSETGTRESAVDYNRSGTPLLEIVSEPDLRSPEEAASYVMSIREIIRFLDISECNMEEGSLRCDANINLWISENGRTYATPIAEIKNMNSFKSIRAALEYEEERQKEEWATQRLTREAAGKITRGWDDERGVTILQRVKEEEADYRYFPEPDIKPIAISEEYRLELTAAVGELPEAKRRRFIGELGLSPLDADALVSSKALSQYFEDVLKSYPEPKKVCNWLLSEVKKALNEKGIAIESFSVSPTATAELLILIDKGTISGKIAKDVFLAMIDTGRSAAEIVGKQGLMQISDEKAILELIDKVITENQASVNDYRQGKEKALKFLMGQLMKLSKGKANPQQAEQLLVRKLKSV